MTVHDLIEVLKSMPADADVWLSVLDFDCGATLKGISTHSAGQMVILSDQDAAQRLAPDPDPITEATLQRERDVTCNGVRLTTDDPRVVSVMGSVPECAANGCQFRETAGYRPDEGPR